jgi:hypothetical protein
MLRSTVSVVAVALATVTLTACGATRKGTERELTLRTHCGVLSARIDGVLWLVSPALGSESGKPPPGWGQNETAGTWRESGDGRAEFRTRSGKLARFVRARPGQRDPATGCE